MRTLERSQNIETLLARIDDLTLARQRLRAENVDADVLEHNRLEIVRAQWELSDALIARHRPGARRRSAA